MLGSIAVPHATGYLIRGYYRHEKPYRDRQAVSHIPTALRVSRATSHLHIEALMSRNPRKQVDLTPPIASRTPLDGSLTCGW
jgi:hypothetical protein